MNKPATPLARQDSDAESIATITDRLAKVSDIYAGLFNITRSNEWYLLKTQEELGELVSAYLKSVKQTRAKLPEAEANQNMRDELADVIAFLLLFARQMDIDVEQALYDKWLHYLD